MSLKTPSRPAARLRLTALVAAPLLALSVACGGTGDSSGGPERSEAVADVPGEPSASAPESGGGGGSGPGAESRPRGKSAYYDAQVTFVQCMRARGGYKDYPDPRLSGYPDWTRIHEIGSRPGRNSGIKAGRDNVCLPELQAAMDAEPERDEQKAYESMLAHATCMRDNGLSRFTNPTMSGGRVIPGGDPSPASPVLDPHSPAYKKAERACASKLIDAAGGMQ
ncbi:hypothetical protein [Streptomyces sp. NPDC001889]